METMFKITPVYLLVIIGLTTSALKPHEGDQVWVVTPGTDKELKFIKNLVSTPQYKLDPWKEARAVNHDAHFLVPSSEIEIMEKILHQKGIGHRVMIGNVQATIDQQTSARERKRTNTKATSIHDFDYSIYHPPEEVYEWIDFVVKEYNFVHKFQLGVTYEGRPMYALHFAKSGIPGKRAIYVDALIHAREWITTATTLWTFKQMLTNPEYESMLDDYDWYFVPMINIDGYAYTWNSDRLWRKTRSKTATGSCVGVDGNRNWAIDQWSVLDPGSSPKLCNFEYHGPHPHSEPEVRHQALFVMERKGHIQVALSIHSYSQLLLYPYNYALDAYPDNFKQLDDIAKATSEAMYKVHQKTYVYGQGAQTLYVGTGYTSDWMRQKAEIPISYTYELRDEGEYGFLLPPEQIIPNGEEFIAGLKVLVQEAQKPVDPGEGSF